MKDFKYDNKFKETTGLVEVEIEDRQIRIKIHPREGGRIPLKFVSNMFSALQNIFDEFGDYYSGKDFRARGPSAKRVKSSIELELIDAHHSDLEAVIELPQFQARITDEKPIGTLSLESFDQTIDVINNGRDIEKEIGELVTDRRHREKILNSFEDFWPNIIDNVDMSVKSGRYTPRILEDEGKEFLRDYLWGGEREGDEEHIGPITGIDIISPLTLKLGKRQKISCTFTKSVEKTARKYIGSVVKIRGVPKTTKVGKPKSLEDIRYIELIDEWSFDKIRWGGTELTFKTPLNTKVNFDFDDEMVIIENEELGILAVADDWIDCKAEFNSYFTLLWNEYAQSPDNELSRDARKLKKLLRVDCTPGSGPVVKKWSCKNSMGCMYENSEKIHKGIQNISSP